MKMLPIVVLALGLAACSQSNTEGQQSAGPVKTSGPAYLVYATNEHSGDISIIDPDSHVQVARIAIGRRPRGLVSSPDHKLLYVAVSGSPIGGPGVDESKLPPPDKTADGIVVIDLATRKPLRTLRGISDPEQIAISPDGERLYVASEDTGKLIVISKDGKIIGEINVGGEPEGVTVSSDGDIILATSESDHSLAIVQGGNQAPKLIAHVPVGERPRNAVFVDPGHVLVPGEFDSSLSLVDLKAAKTIRTYHFEKDDRPMGLKVDARGIAYLTTGRGGRLLRLDSSKTTDKDVITGAVKAGERPWGLALSPDGGTAFTANGPGNDVSIVDTASMKITGRVRTGDGPWGVAAIPVPADTP